MPPGYISTPKTPNDQRAKSKAGRHLKSRGHLCYQMAPMISRFEMPSAPLSAHWPFGVPGDKTARSIENMPTPINCICPLTGEQSLGLRPLGLREYDLEQKLA